jgi:hypothetical protein
MNLLTTDENFNIIKSVLRSAFNRKSIDIQDKYDTDIKQVIQFINNRIQNINETNIQSLNKKVLDFSFKNISDKMVKPKPPPPKNRASVESVFDGEVSSETNPSDFMPPPSINQNNRESIDDLLQHHESERKLIDPSRPMNTPKNVSFAEDDPEIDQKQAYEDMLKQRGIGLNEFGSNEFNINGVSDDMSTPIGDIQREDIQDFEIDKSIKENVIKLVDNNIQPTSIIQSNNIQSNNIQPTSIIQPVKTHYITIDSRFRNLELYPSPSNFHIIFNEIYSNVKSIQLIHITLPSINITSYLKLYVDELPSHFVDIRQSDKPYFTKLIQDGSNVKNITDDEIKFNTTSLGIIDKMTLNLQTAFNTDLIDIDDKVFITKCIDIDGDVKIYTRNEGLSNLVDGDIVYIYNTTPNMNDTISFNKDIIISAMDILEYQNEDKEELVKINATYYSYLQSNNMEVDAQSMLKNDKMEMEERKYNFEDLLNTDTDYLYILYKNTEDEDVYEEMVKIYNIVGEDLIIVKPMNYYNDIGYEIQEFKYARKIKCGFNVSNTESLYYIGGHKVYDVEEDSFCVKDVRVEDIDESFYIHHNKQINYTFKIIV